MFKITLRSILNYKTINKKKKKNDSREILGRARFEKISSHKN